MTIEEVATLLTAWQLPGDEREQVLDEIQVGSSAGWWDRPVPGVPQEVGALASYEADAYELVGVNITALPGLLQTYETAAGVLAADGVSAADIETSWMARLRRQQILMKITYTAFISETALRTPYGGSLPQARSTSTARMLPRTSPSSNGLIAWPFHQVIHVRSSRN